jgi:ankyrin repeat protein
VDTLSPVPYTNDRCKRFQRASGAEQCARHADALTQGRTALHVAAYGGQQHAVELLLDSAATVDVADVHGVTALMAACGRGHAGLARTLLRRGADVARCDHQGRNALHHGETQVVVASPMDSNRTQADCN